MEFKAIELARRLAEARRTGRPVDGLDPGLRPATADQGYAVQAALVGDDGAVAGYKVALTSAGAQSAFGAAEPIAGRLSVPDVLRSPANLRSDALPKFAEAEVVFVMAGTLDPERAPFSVGEVRREIGEVHAGLELCSTRYAWDEVSLPELVGDNANAWSLVIGDTLPDWRAMDLANIRVTLSRRGHASIQGTTAAVLGDPLRSLTWLANWLAGRGQALRSGQVVASGSCTGITALGAEPEDIIADLGGLARARAIITPKDRSTKPR